MISWRSVVSEAVYGMPATRAPVPTHLILKIKKRNKRKLDWSRATLTCVIELTWPSLFGTKALLKPITNDCLLSVGPLWLNFNEILNKIHIYGILVPDEVLDLQCITLPENRANITTICVNDLSPHQLLVPKSCIALTIWGKITTKLYATSYGSYSPVVVTIMLCGSRNPRGPAISWDLWWERLNGEDNVPRRSRQGLIRSHNLWTSATKSLSSRQREYEWGHYINCNYSQITMS